MKLHELFESKDPFTPIVKKVAADYGFDGNIEGRNEADWTTVIIGDQSMTFKIDKDGNLHLADIYVPAALRDRGFMTDLLKKMRTIDGLSGTAVVHVGLNPAWEKIVTRAGFEFKRP